MLLWLQFLIRILRTVSPRLLFRAGRLWVVGGHRAMRAYQKRLERGEHFPPFFFIALTDACNLKCRGCWIGTEGATIRELPFETANRVISEGKKQGCRYFTLLGGEPFLYRRLFDLVEAHPDCYFQIITNGLFLDAPTVSRISELGNITPLVSLDGNQATNDERRGKGVYRGVLAGLAQLRAKKILFGVATTVTAANFEEVLCDAYVQKIIDSGATYLWYYGYRPVGANPTVELALSKDQMRDFRRRLIDLRTRHPIILIDTYWRADGEAVCPAAQGLGYHIGPAGHIELCPPITFACETIDQNGGDLFKTINQSDFLRDFGPFVDCRTRGCIILEQPDALLEYLLKHGAVDSSGRDAWREFAGICPQSSHHLPGEQIPEKSLVYRFLKRKLFFGPGAYG
jgi:MoaA/NifB/PqqE/SkfB family radical SAM enzyme